MFVNQPRSECKDKKELLETFDNCFTLAQAYIPYQKVDALFPPETGLVKGTIFPNLYRPYSPKECRCQV